jgi:hypothetical protein
VVYVLQETIEGKSGFYGQLPLSEFISAPTTVPTSEFSAVFSNPNGVTSFTFVPDLSGGGCAEFDLSNCDLIHLTTGFHYGFPVGTFSTLGEYTATDGAFSMKLTELATTPAPAPEASTWAMMLLGFAGLAYAGFKRSSKARLSEGEGAGYGWP